ncbi:ester cyclase [Chryseobacterium indologenes]|uniref:ester cyclase n=1 Tax=Chryseobacterium indologenes TaxID=253 RepID=UPI0021A5852D|nr:ester cyclase [Elizabethkingia anophelis]
MNTEKNKNLVREFYDLIEKEDYKAVAQLCHEDFTFYFQVDSPIPGAEGFVASEKANFDAFRGFKMPIHQLIAEEDKVAAYLIFEGNHNNAILMGIEPTNKFVRFSLMMMLTIKDGKIFEKRAHFDRADILNQISQ